MMTATTTLTDRYVYAATRSLPESQRADIEKELRASIVDAIESRIEAGEDPAATERSTLTELGDPMRLASEYADRPSWLIGPRYYFTWLRLLKLLFTIVLPIVFAAVFIVGFITGGVGQAFGDAFSVSITIAVHLAFWPTAIFALVERSGNKHPLDAWTPDTLPQVPEVNRSGNPGRLGELIPSLVFLLFFAAAIVWQQFFSVVSDPEGRPIPLVSPDLWAFWMPYVLVIIALELVFAGVLYAVGRWNRVLASVHVPLSLAFAIPGIWLLLTHQVWNPEFIAQVGWGDAATRLIDPISAGVIALVTIADIADAFVKSRRERAFSVVERSRELAG